MMIKTGESIKEDKYERLSYDHYYPLTPVEEESLINGVLITEGNNNDNEGTNDGLRGRKLVMIIGNHR